MTKLTLEQQKALAEKVWPHCEWKITRESIKEVNVDYINFWDPSFDEDANDERSQALAVLEYYAKNIEVKTWERGGLKKLESIYKRITLALRTGDLDPVALEIIGETK